MLCSNCNSSIFNELIQYRHGKEMQYTFDVTDVSCTKACTWWTGDAVAVELDPQGVLRWRHH